MCCYCPFLYCVLLSEYKNFIKNHFYNHYNAIKKCIKIIILMLSNRLVSNLKKKITLLICLCVHYIQMMSTMLSVIALLNYLRKKFLVNNHYLYPHCSHLNWLLSVLLNNPNIDTPITFEVAEIF